MMVQERVKCLKYYKAHLKEKDFCWLAIHIEKVMMKMEDSRHPLALHSEAITSFYSHVQHKDQSL